MLPDTNYVAAVVKLRGYDDYLSVRRRGRSIRAWSRICSATQESVSEFADLEATARSACRSPSR